MKFEIQQEDLQKALDVIAAVVPSKTTLPILSCVLVVATKESLTLSATNLDISITTSTTKATVKDPGRVAIPAVKFVPFVRSLRPGVVTISQKGDQLTLTSGKSRLTENTMNVNDFPALKKPEEKAALAIPADTLIDMINETAYAVSRDETRPALMGILWEVRAASLTMVATDAHRLARSARCTRSRSPSFAGTRRRQHPAGAPGLSSGRQRSHNGRWCRHWPPPRSPGTRWRVRTRRTGHLPELPAHGGRPCAGRWGW